MVVSSAHSRVSFSQTIYFDIPDELMIDPKEIIDDDVYRITIGKGNLTPDEAVAYQPLFDELNKRIADDKDFVTNIHFCVEDKELIFKLAHVCVWNSPFGVIYDIEAAIDDTEYREGNDVENTVNE